MALNKPGRKKGAPRTAAEIEADRFRTGRPKKETKTRKSILVALRLTEDEFELFAQDAQAFNMSSAAFAKHCWLLTKRGKK